MRAATFLAVSALGVACAHQPAPPAPAPTPTGPQANAALSDGSGDPRLGSLELASQPAAARAEAPSELGHEGQGEASGSAREPRKDEPRAIAPAAPTVATTPPGSDPAPAQPQAASKSEAELRERIQRALQRDRSLSFTAKRVRVEVERGRVTLLGEVRTAREKTDVEELVEKVSGVQHVKNELAVISQTPVAKTPDLSSSENQRAR